MRMVVSPERFDVIATTNMFGDIITDLGAVLQGGMGLAASGNLNPARTAPEHVRAGPRLGARHRRQGDRQPDRRDPLGGDAARPPRTPPARPSGSAAPSPGCWRPAAPKTPDLGGNATTADVGRAVREALE